MVSTIVEGTPDPQTVSKDGRRLMRPIDGVALRPAITHPDERGELCEIYDPTWGVLPAPLTYVYMATVRPGKIKGWVYHEFQDDRLFVAFGAVKIVLYDLRAESPTKGMINEFHVTERNRGLLVVPRMVAHAVQNIGSVDAAFINMPTKPFNHEKPDKRRIPLDSPDIPYSFEPSIGW